MTARGLRRPRSDEVARADWARLLAGSREKAVRKSIERWRWHGRSIPAMLAFEGRQRVDKAGCSAQVSIEREPMKGSQKPKKLGKKQPQKTLKQRRAEKRGAAKPGRAFEV